MTVMAGTSTVNNPTIRPPSKSQPSERHILIESREFRDVVFEDVGFEHNL